VTTYDLGDVVPIGVETRDTEGDLANATTVTVTITLPDGTTSGPHTVSSTSTGVYQYDYTPTQVGRHTAYWKAEGTNKSAFTRTFEVLDPAREPLIQPDELRTALRNPDIAEADAEAVVLVASELVRDHCRQQITRATYTTRLAVDCDRRGWFIAIPEGPLRSVTTVVVNGTTVTTHTVDLLNGKVRLPSGVPTEDADDDVEDQAVVTYVAGYDTVPGNVRAVTLALAIRLYDNPQGLRSRQIDDYSETRAGNDDDLAGVSLLPGEERRLRRYRLGAVGSVAVRG
jgi:hypothetical protein